MTDERALVAASRDGDPAALEALVRSHQDRVYGFAMRMCRNVEDAKDILQDTFLVGQEVLGFIERMPQPVIGVINGFALGCGCEVAMACDMLVAADTAKFGQPEVNLGIIPGYGGTQRLPRLVGRNVAKELVLTGELISAQRAYEIGLANRVVPGAELMAAAREIAKKILSRGPVAVRMAKMAMNRGLDMDLQNGCALEASLFAVGFATEDRVEGITAFIGKRKPRFQGEVTGETTR